MKRTKDMTKDDLIMFLKEIRMDIIMVKIGVSAREMESQLDKIRDKISVVCFGSPD